MIMTTKFETKIRIWNNLWIGFWLLTVVDFAANKVLDRDKIDVAKDSPFDLKCANKTSGTFASLVWTTTAYKRQGRTTLYSIDAYGKEEISQHFANRISRFNETSLRVHYALLNDTGNYECNIIEQYIRKGEKRKRMRVLENALHDVEVISPPTKIKLSQRVVAAAKGKNITVDCSARSRSTFKFIWTKENGDPVGKIQVRETTNEYAGYIVRRSFMTLGPFDATDVGYYVCRVENIAGVLQKRLEMRLKKPPLIQSLNEVHATINKDVTLQCVSRGFHYTHFKWVVPIKRGTKVIEEGHQWERFSVDNTRKSNDYLFTSTLRVKNVQKRDLHKTYKCQAMNDQGEDEKEIVLRGYAMPGRPIIEKSKIAVDVDRIKLQWRVPDNGGKPVESITIEYKNSSSLDDWTKMKIGRAIYSYIVMNLSPGVSYNFKVSVTNSVGSSEYSEIVTRKTKDIDNGAVVAHESILNQLNITSLIGIFGGIFVAVIIAFVCMCIIIRRMQKRDFSPHDPSSYTPASVYNTAPTLPHPHANNNGNGHLPDGISLHDHTIVEMQPILSQTPDEWEFPRDRLQITTVLGAGEFGIVMRGLAEGIKGSVGQVIVAVKTVRDTNNDAATKDLLAELNLLKSIPQHPNVVGLLGCCTRVDPAYVIVEYCANGDLQGFLRSSRGIYERYYKTSYGCTVPNLTSKMLLTFAWQISKGLAHLATMKVIHRDLAARNILVDEHLVCRVSDFGFARDIYVEDHYLKRSAGGRFPIKWMAIESLLDGISTTKSDVWSFGVVMWELVTLGASPYPGMNSYEVVTFLQNGYRMDKPKHCSDTVYSLLLDCWNVNPNRRPSFQDLTTRCHQLHELCDTEELIDMKFYQDHLYVNFDYAESSHASASSCSNIHASRQNSIDTLDNIDSRRDGGSSQPLLNGGVSQPLLNGASHQHLNGVGRKPYLPQSMNNLPPVGLRDTDGPPLPGISYNSANTSLSQSISHLTSNNSLNRTYSNDIAVRMASRQ